MPRADLPKRGPQQDNVLGQQRAPVVVQIYREERTASRQEIPPIVCHPVPSRPIRRVSLRSTHPTATVVMMISYSIGKNADTNSLKPCPSSATCPEGGACISSQLPYLTSVLPSAGASPMAAIETLTTTVSTKGQVILPKAVRERRNWGAGTRLVVEDTPEGVLLKAAPVFASA